LQIHNIGRGGREFFRSWLFVSFGVYTEFIEVSRQNEKKIFIFFVNY